MRQRAAASKADDFGYEALMVRSLSQNHHDWLKANDARSQLRRLWRALFADLDVLITPMSPTPAYPHIRDIPKEDQINMVDGRRRPASDTYFWIGLAATAYLPATVVPAGLSAEGLPVGVQIIGPDFSDRRCLVIAQLLEQAHRAFTPPPAYA